MCPLVIKVTPHKIERAIFVIIIIILLYGIFHYMKLYYQSTEDSSTVGKMFKGSLFQKVEIKKTVDTEELENISEEANNVTNTTSTTTTKTEENKTTTTTKNETTTPKNDTVTDNKKDTTLPKELSFTMSMPGKKLDGSGEKYGEIDDYTLTVKNGLDENRKIKYDVYLWDQMAVSYGTVASKKKYPIDTKTTPVIESKTVYTHEYDLDKVKYIWGGYYNAAAMFAFYEVKDDGTMIPIENKTINITLS